MRNGPLNTSRRAHIEERKGYKDAQNTSKRHPKSRPLKEAVLSDAVGTIYLVEIVGIELIATPHGARNVPKSGVLGAVWCPI
jgi:hypothetical protein